MPVLWTFRTYVDAQGIDVIRTWYERSPPKVRAKFLSRLRALAGLPRQDWKENLHKNLVGACAGISEIRFEVGNVQYRPLGFHSGDHEFTILSVAIEKGWKFIPKSSGKTALARRAEVEAKRRNTNALWLALE